MVRAIDAGSLIPRIAAASSRDLPLWCFAEELMPRCCPLKSELLLVDPTPHAAAPQRLGHACAQRTGQRQHQPTHACPDLLGGRPCSWLTRELASTSPRAAVENQLSIRNLQQIPPPTTPGISISARHLLVCPISCRASCHYFCFAISCRPRVAPTAARAKKSEHPSAGANVNHPTLNPPIRRGTPAVVGHCNTCFPHCITSRTAPHAIQPPCPAERLFKNSARILQNNTTTSRPSNFSAATAPFLSLCTSRPPWLTRRTPPSMSSTPSPC